MDEKVLSLQEKMVLVRREIPALVKKTYSEDVSYDFTKIDDIFRYLTPAMNQYRVNWEIESETATIKDNLGNPIYVRYLERAGLWMYEADLKIRWINAELPEDSFAVTVHAIGTHEMPEKAKGSGWTYALKYYLLDKYGIDQGGEDPDMRNSGVPYDDGFQPDCADEYGNSGASVFSETGNATASDYGNAGATVQTGLADEQEGEYVGQEEVQQEMTENEFLGAVQNQEPENPDSNAEAKRRETEQPVQRTIHRPTVSRSLRPENGKMVELPESAGKPEQEGETGHKTWSSPSGNRARTMQGTTQRQQVREPEPMIEEPVEPNAATDAELEKAYAIVCGIGLDRGKTLGEIAGNGAQGLETLEWLAYTYKGKNEELRQGARLILECAKKAA